MIAKSYIQNTLNELDKLYNNSPSQKKAIYYSKLTILELCGWIEESFDDIILRYANRHLIKPDNKIFCKEKIVKINYGFQYDQNIRPMLMKVIGLINLEKIETKLEKTAQITLLRSNLGNLKVLRNDVAHTYLKGVTRRYNAPSKTIADFHRIYGLLKSLENELRKFI